MFRPYTPMDATMIAVPPDVKEIFDAFWNAQYHGYLWPSQTIAVVSVQGRGVNVLYNTGRDHVEQKLIRYIKEFWTDIPSLCLNVYINYSPCGKCARDILNFLKANEKVNINMRVAALYDIGRYSCMRNNHCHEMTDSSRECLTELLDYGARSKQLYMGVFNLEIWNQLVRLLKQVSQSMHYSGIVMGGATGTNSMELYSYIYSCSEENEHYPEHNRRIEDELMRQDLKELCPY